ncbi:hypothetical protein CDES_00110 [Corynebacterium deserti GIMN1.010]|uniref:Uncharacterized protein n=1 Tax=Corynebacterium deserti GIMN1.010 TaxID=931089 RepID=A0A0M4CJH6_9CORY|nr:hypothetical protein [Corynebacterium deserti]ALC04510.1 hypothetical protein CDES_00110 [Corynebacterium deserti GIMN1.010]
MSDSSSPRLQVLIDGTTAPARVLTDLKKQSALGFSELRALIASRNPVLDVEMFTNDWYDSGAVRVLDLLSRWEAEGVDYILRETLNGQESLITLDELRNMIESGEEELEKLRRGRSS